MADEPNQQKGLSEACELQAIRRELDSNTALIGEVLRLSALLTTAMEQMIYLDTKVSDMSEAQMEIQATLGKQQAMLETLMTWHNNQKALRGALGWLIDKAPTLAAVAVFLFWVLDQWQNKKGGGS